MIYDDGKNYSALSFNYCWKIFSRFCYKCLSFNVTGSDTVHFIDVNNSTEANIGKYKSRNQLYNVNSRGVIL